jgi:hypothetical protein
LNPIPQKEECYEDQEVASGQPSLVASTKRFFGLFG